MAGTPSGGAAPFSCPRNFTATSPASEPTRFSLEVLRDPDTELWLIQAPVDFAPDCLNGRLVPLSGSRIVKGKLAGKRHRYRVLRSSGPQAGEAILLAPSGEAGGGLTCAPAPQGSLRIFDGPQESPSGTLLQPIPASPPPQIPPGLRPRFCAFGGSLPVTGPGSILALKSAASRKRKKKRHVPEASVPQEAVNGLGALEASPGGEWALGSPDGDVKKKKKKQQLKEIEVMEPVAAEPMADTSEPPGAPFLSTTTKKKKKKPQGTETDGPEEQMLAPEGKTVEPELTIKREPLEEPVLSPTGKKKRHKGMEGREPGEGRPAEAPPPPKVEPQEEAIPLPSSKKKKTEKGYKVMTEPGTEVTEPEVGLPALPGEMVGPPAEAALASARKRRKKEKWPNATGEPSGEPEPLGDLELQAALAATKKKKERGHKVMEPRAEVSAPPAEVLEPEPSAEGEPEATADPAFTTKRKKRSRGSGVPETAAREETPAPPLCLESGEAAPPGREKKWKKLQRGPV